MKRFWLGILLVCVVMVSGCKSAVTLEDNKSYACIGLGNTPNPKLIYKASVRNIVVGIVFIEVIIPPVVVAVNEFYCPIGLR